MISLTTAQISEILNAPVISGSNQTIAEAVTIDSRATGDGDCFFAIIGERLDGHDFIDHAMLAGATVVVAERPLEPSDIRADTAIIQVDDTTAALQTLAGWLRRQLDPIVVGITGSLGKTTSKELTAALLGARYDVHATPGNLNNHWGLPLSLLGLEAHHQVTVVEMAMSRAGEIGALARLARPDIGVITNVAPAHMENFTDLKDVAAAKGELAGELPASGTLIVNADDPYTDTMPEQLAPHVARVVRFGCAASADVRADNLIRSPAGWAFDLHVGSASCGIDLQIPGAPGVSSFLAAAATAHALDVSIEEIAAEAPNLRPLSNRGAIHRTDGITLLDESYNASPRAVQAALETLATLPGDRHIAVLGDMLEMGDWTDRVHREAGRNAAENDVDLLVAVGDCAALMADGAAEAGMASDAVRAFDSAEKAASWLTPRLQHGDTVLIKGSRAVHLERVVKAVTAAGAVSNGVLES